MKYKNIKKILKNQINKKVRALWTFDENSKTFTHLYHIPTNDLRIYTPEQLLEYLEKI